MWLDLLWAILNCNLNAINKPRTPFTMITFWEQRERVFGEENRGKKTQFVLLFMIFGHKCNPLHSLTAIWKNRGLCLREIYESKKNKRLALICYNNCLLFIHNKNLHFAVVTHRCRLSCSSCSPVGGPAGGTGNGTARTQRTMGSWCWCPDAASGSNHQRSWPLLTAASWWFRPLLPAHNPLQPRNGRPIHHWGERKKNRL